jgi:hypothetical protein
VQKPPGDAVALLFSRRPATPHLQAFAVARQTSQINFRKLIFANQGTQESRLRITARRSLHAGKVPNGVGLEKPAAPLPSPPNRRKIVSSFVVTLSCSVVLWSWRRDLNPRPPDYKSGALPTELRQQLGKDAPSRKLIPLIPARCPGQLIKLSQWELLAQAWGPVSNWVLGLIWMPSRPLRESLPAERNRRVGKAVARARIARQSSFHHRGH